MFLGRYYLLTVLREAQTRQLLSLPGVGPGAGKLSPESTRRKKSQDPQPRSGDFGGTFPFLCLCYAFLQYPSTSHHLYLSNHGPFFKDQSSTILTVFGGFAFFLFICFGSNLSDDEHFDRGARLSLHVDILEGKRYLANDGWGKCLLPLS